VLHDKGVEQAVVSIRVPNDPVGALFRVPVDDWAAISPRAGYTAPLRNIAATAAESLPQFPVPLAGCATNGETTHGRWRT
jgi:hypothetical protein